jgi:hypothetical protein
MNVAVLGLDKLLSDIEKQNKAVHKAVDRAVVATAIAIQTEAVQSIQTQERGDKKVKRGKNFHYVSPEGGPPNADTGRLHKSIAINHVKNSKVAYVYSTLEYAAYLEFVLNRPWLQPATEGKADLLKDRILLFTRDALK